MYGFILAPPQAGQHDNTVVNLEKWYESEDADFFALDEQGNFFKEGFDGLLQYEDRRGCKPLIMFGEAGDLARRSLPPRSPAYDSKYVHYNLLVYADGVVTNGPSVAALTGHANVTELTPSHYACMLFSRINSTRTNPGSDRHVPISSAVKNRVLSNLEGNYVTTLAYVNTLGKFMFTVAAVGKELTVVQSDRILAWGTDSAWLAETFPDAKVCYSGKDVVFSVQPTLDVRLPSTPMWDRLDKILPGE